ncbi:MAG: SpoIIE family protein phosphatase [Desulfobacterales bacterium]
MDSLFKRLILINGIGISLLIAFFYLNIVVPSDSSQTLKLFTDAYAADIKTAGGQSLAVPPELPQFNRRLDVYEFIVGVFLTSLGLIAIVLACLRWKAKNLFLLSFGVFCIIYGARTNAFRFLFDASRLFWSYERWILTYLLPIPGFIFVEQILGRGWKSSIRRMWQIAIAFAVVAILAGIYLHKPWAAYMASNILSVVGLSVILVNLFWRGLSLTREIRILRVGFVVFAVFSLHANLAYYLFSGNFAQDLEPVGLLVLFGCLGYTIAIRFFQNEKDLITIEHELETARQIQSFILPRDMPKIKGLEIAARYVPMATMAGDFYDFLVIDDKRIGILVADVSGHGVPASLIASMVKIAFVSQAPHASDPARVLAGLNQILCGKLDSDFVTGGYLFIDTEQQTASYAGAGHPPLFLWRQREKEVLEIRQKGIILGQMEETSYKHSDLKLQKSDRFVLYTDGIVEALNPAGKIYGADRLKAFIESNSDVAAEHFCDGLVDTIAGWSGRGSKNSLDDDLTLLVVDFETTAA